MPRNERLRQQRILRNWRQQDVADQLGVALVSVQRWERGYQQPGEYYRIRLCTLFGLSALELGLIEAVPPPPESSVSEAEPTDAGRFDEPALWTIPYARNPHFTGRDDVLYHLELQFAPTASGQPTTMRQAALTQAQAIKGLGGIGKTQIAVEYAYRAHEQGRYTHTLWINAASEEAILTSFVALANLLPDAAHETEQHKLMAAARRWLEGCEQPWLLIVDNADELSLVQPYLPSRGNGHILLTTRASAVGALASSIEVDTMGIVESIQLLLRRAQRFTEASAEEIDEAGNIVMALAQFPLALDQAGAYIEETGCSLSDYLQIYQQHRQALLARRGRQATGYPEPVATTWSLSFQHVEQVNPAAAELLRLCAFLSPDHIPEELLTEGAPYWPPALQEAVADRFSFNQMLEALLAFSLVKRLSENHLLSLHRLVQVVQMESMKPEEQREWVERVVRALHAIFPPDPTMVAWSQCQRYLEQMQACDLLIQKYQILLPEAVDLLDRTGTCLRECALYALAEPLFWRALHILEQQAEPEPLQAAESLSNLATLRREQGKYAEAEPLHLQALHIREQRVGPEHRLVAQSLNNLALLYQEQGKYAEAEPLHLRALRIKEQQVGPVSLQAAASLQNLALLYHQQGKHDEARSFYLRALPIWEQQLGPENHKVAYSLMGLATLCYDEGKYEEAEPLYRRVFHIWEQRMGPEHRLVARPLNGLANLYFQQGRYEEAERLYQRALHIREQQPGPEHLETAETLHDFANFQQAQGKALEAVLLYQRAQRIREQVLGPDHSLTTTTREHLQIVLAALGQMEKAAENGCNKI